MQKSIVSSLLLLSLLFCCTPTATEDSPDGGSLSNSTVLLYYDDFEGNRGGAVFEWATPQWNGNFQTGVSISEYFGWCGSSNSCLRLFADGDVNEKVVTQRAANLMALSSTKQPVSRILLSFHCRFVTDRRIGNAAVISISNNGGKRFRRLRQLKTAESNNVPKTITLEIPSSYWTFGFVLKLKSKAKPTLPTDFYVDDIQLSAVLGSGDGEFLFEPTVAPTTRDNVTPPPTPSPSSATSPPTTIEATLAPTGEGTSAPTADGGGMPSDDTTGKATLAPTGDGTLAPTIPADNRRLSSEEKNEGYFQLF